MRLYYLQLLLWLLPASFYAQKNTSPIGFIENKGQIVDLKGKENKNVQFLLNTPGLNVQLRNNGFSYDIYEAKKVPLTQKDKGLTALPTPFTKEQTTPDYTLEYTYHRIDVDFENSNPGVQLVAEGKSADYDNYYNVVHAPEGITGVHKYQKVTYQNIYNQIDVVFFIPKDSTKAVEYNFIVKPGGRVSDIQMQFKGAKTELVDNKIKMSVRFGQMEETLPLSWIEQGNTKKEIAVNYVNIKKNVYGFAGDVNASDKTIVIDPVPVRLWGTYYAGNVADFSKDICNDNNNNVYFSGYTFSQTNIATSGSYTEHNYSYFNGNGFIVKFNSNGVRLWGIYSIATPKKINTDNTGNLYFTGDIGIQMPVISTPNSHQPVHYGLHHSAFLIKINASGIREWGTYYGGSSNESGKDICFDAQDNVYLVGTARSHDNIATNNTHQTTHAPGYLDEDGFIVKFNPDGVRIWGTYYGGDQGDQINSCSISDDGFLYVTGTTGSNQGIATPNSYNPAFQGYGSGMMAKFDLDGNRIWGSYFNGLRFCWLNQSIVKGNHLYLQGITDDQTNMNTSGTFNENFAHLPMSYGNSSFIAKFNLSTESLVWGTYFGEYIQDIAINTDDKILIVGCTDQTTGIATPGAFSEVPQYTDAYIIKLNGNGQQEWGTYYGGECGENPNGEANVNNKVSVDSTNDIYLIGNTCSTRGLSTPGAHQESHVPNPLGGIQNTFLAKFQDCLLNPTATSNSPICIGQNLQLNASGGATYSWTGPNGFTSMDQNPVITTANASHSGQYSCTITGTGGCDVILTVNVVVGDTTAPVPNVTTLPTITGDCHTVVATIPSATDNCAGVINGTTTDPLTYTIPGNYTIVWSYNDGNGNTSTQNQSVVITATTLPTANASQQFCIQQNATLATIAITGQNIQWYDASTGGNLLSANTVLQDGVTYYASQTINGCESARIPFTAYIQNTPAPTGNTNQSFCTSENATLNNIAIAGTEVQWYASPVSTQPLPITTLLADNTTYYATQTIKGCESVNRLAVTITLINTLNAQNHQVEFCDAQDNGSEIIDLSSYNTNLIANTTGNTFSYYKSLIGAENQSASERITNFSSYPLQTGITTIYVRIDNVNTCHQIVTVQLTLFSNPVIPIQNIMPICEGSSITVDAGSGNTTYNWSTGATTQQITITTPGNYSVTVTQDHTTINCSTTKSFTVVNSNIATIENIVISEWTTANNTITVLLTSNSQGDYVYSLDGVNYQSDNTFANLPSGQYTVYVKDKNGCGITEKEVLLLMYPKFFTPNGDGYNDYWQIDNSTAKANFTISIFDRLGKLLKTIDSHSVGWDGTFNGQPLSSTDYWFSFTMDNGKEYKGHFALKR